MDQESNILTAPIRSEVSEYLARNSQLLMDIQADCGSWPLDWYRRAMRHEQPAGDNRADDWSTVLVTSHHLEWLMLLPSELLPESNRLLRSAQWLEEQAVAAEKDTLMEHYCPYSHAVRAVALLRPSPCEKCGDLVELEQWREASRGPTRSGDRHFGTDGDWEGYVNYVVRSSRSPNRTSSILLGVIKKGDS